MKVKAAVVGAMGSVMAVMGLSMVIGFGFRWGIEVCEITFKELDKAIDKGVNKYYEIKKTRKEKDLEKKLRKETEETIKEFDA